MVPFAWNVLQFSHKLNLRFPRLSALNGILLEMLLEEGSLTSRPWTGTDPVGSAAALD